MGKMREVVFALMMFALFSFVGCAVAEEEDAMLWLTGPKKTVAVFIESGTSKLEYGGKPMEIIKVKIEEILPQDKFSILPLEETEEAMLEYKEDNRILVSEHFSGRATREDVQNVCKSIGGVDYALLVYVSGDIPRGKVAALGLSSSFTVSVVCDVRFLDIETREYIAKDKAEAKGKSSSVMIAGAPSPDRAFIDGLSKALSKIKLDISTL